MVAPSLTVTYVSLMVTGDQRIGEPLSPADRTLEQADLSRCLTCLVLWAFKNPFVGYKDV